MTFPNGGRRDEGHPSRQVGKALYQPNEFDIPSAANLTEDQYGRLMSTSLGHDHSFRGRTAAHARRVFSDKMYYQD